MASLTTTGLSEAFALLAHPYRRFVLYYLTNESETVAVDTLAAAIATWEESHTGRDRSADRDVIEVELHHTHLPKLVDAGVVTVRADGNAIELRETEGLVDFLGDTVQIDGYTRTVADD